MSWFGEQISSLTGKLTEITRDVLTDSGGNAGGEVSSENGDNLSQDNLLDLLRMRMTHIEMLKRENETLEKNLEELDSEHQESINQLLLLKNEAVKENTRLRNELASKTQTLKEKTMFFGFEPNLKTSTQLNTLEPLSVDSITESMKKINFINILGILWKNVNIDTIHNIIQWLTSQIDSLESQAESLIDPLLIERIKVYVNFLQQISQNPDVFSPIIHEIATVMYYFLSNNSDLLESTSRGMNSTVNNDLGLNSMPSPNTCDFSAQAAIPDLRHVLHLFSPYPEPFICDMADSPYMKMADSSMQTEPEVIHYCSAMIQDMRDSIVLLEDEKLELTEQVEALNERVQALSSVPKSEASVETDKELGSFKLIELENCVKQLEQEKLELTEKVSQLMYEVEHKSIFSVASQTEVDGFKVDKLQEYISTLKQEKSDLLMRVSDMQKLITPLSTTETQTDDSYHDIALQLSGLQAHISILEHENSDLQEKLSDFESRNTLVKAIQTEEDSLTNLKIIELQTCISILEQEKSDISAEVLDLRNQKSQSESSCFDLNPQDYNHTNNSDYKILDSEQGIYPKQNVSFALIQTDDYECGCNIYELEAMICILEQEKADLEAELLILRCREHTSVEIQTDQTGLAMNLLENECEELKNKLIERESFYKTSQNELKDEIFLLHEEVNCSESCIDEKENIINSLTFELQESKMKIRELSQNQSLRRFISSASTQTIESLNSYEAYKSQLTELKNSIAERETAFSVMQNEMNVVIDGLKKELESKIIFINENENIIQSLKSSVDSYEKYIKDLSEKSSHLKISEVQTDEIKCSCERYESQIANLQKYAEARERELKAAETDLTKVVCMMEKELGGKNDLIFEKDNELQLLRNQVEEQIQSINYLNSQIQPDKCIASTESQTVENQSSYDEYEAEIMQLKSKSTENESSLQQNQTLDSINNLKEELETKCILISEKDAIIGSLESNVKKYRNDIDSLTRELIAFKSGNCEESCPCKKYESEIADLRMFISEKDKIFKATQTNLVSSVDSLKEAIKDKESFIKERDVTISTLKEELAEAKRSMKIHFNKLALNAKLDKDIDTVEESNIKNLVQNCNKCRSEISKEFNDNDFKNEVKSLQEKLKALDLDKNQLLCVLNEKSQECSALKAEVHKLTNIVASEKQALFKLQQDNCMLRESTDNIDPELTKEAVKKLSQIIRDKDLEIESLRQKNVTLTSLIQAGSASPDHLQSIMEEKENLEKQIKVLKADQDKIMLSYNTVNKDCEQYAAEVNQLKTALSAEKKKFDILEQKHFSVAQQYEEKQKSLINTQNEMIALKQRVTDLEEQQVDIKEKYGELLNKINEEKEDMVQLSKVEVDERTTLIEDLQHSNSEKDHLIQEKDCLILELSQQMKTHKSDYEQELEKVSILQKKVEELSYKLKEQNDLMQKLQSEHEALDLRFQDKSAEVELVKEMNDRLNMSVKEKEFTIQSMTDKISSLSQFISSDHSSTSETVDINQILADSELMFSRAQSLYKERDETLLTLSQSKQENQSLRNEIQRMKSSEIHLNKELERLRMHLIEIEENYTQEALKAEEREKELQDEILELKHKAEVSNSAVVDTSQRASLQIASLQEQLSMIANQRDLALAQASSLEDKVQQQSASVSKLQCVLEQIQRGNEKKIRETEKKFTALIEKEKQFHKNLENKLQEKEMQLEETSQALEAASRLSEQLDAKEETVRLLKNELSKTESKMRSTALEIDNIRSNTEGKVDRVVMKSLVLGYFSTPPDKKSEVIRLLARVLDFNQEEMEKAGIVVGRNAQKNEQRGLISSIFGRFPSLSSERTESGSEQSFTTLFVQFLENESQPFIPIKFPAEKMNPELPMRQPSTSKKSLNEKKKLSLASPLLLDIDSAFPTFSPVPAIEYSDPSSAILREVLK